uniref:Family with sequence similarity 83 member B n=1 Tax=Paramormyrops kingsleyae TaxID=1676925 RepID=A0A3B3T4G5_9TELE|nr:protein FAM83B [Paramormyrops kingsleyae]
MIESQLSSLTSEIKPDDFIRPHYKETYRLAIDALVGGGQEAYRELLKGERVGEFLSEDELLFIVENVERPITGDQEEEADPSMDNAPSSGTYWPLHSDLDTPNLDLGWPDVREKMQTNINLLFHPPRPNCPTIKEAVRKHIQEARHIIAIVMDIFTDVDIFKEVVDASSRGVAVYILLDERHVKAFLRMTEKQDVHIQRLRNIRVRTVKGQEYLCRSGAKFYGAMGEKFLLVDCQTVVYGSYSFMWSYEKINLSMVQVITGQLVESYDEEFRMLYARSLVPSAFAPPEAMMLEGKPDGGRPLVSYGAKHGQPFERRDQLRHTLDTVYMKACGSQARLKNTVDDLDQELHDKGLFNQHAPNGHMIHQRIAQLQATDHNNFLKRHSYAGERNETSHVPNHLNYGLSQWNVARDCGQFGITGRNDYLSRALENPLQSRLSPGNYIRGNNIRQTYHGHDKQMLSMQQNMPSLERTSRSFLRTWRIESYLSNEEPSIKDPSDYLDYNEGLDGKPNPYMHSRLRSSLVFKSTIPEQPESNSYTTNSQSSGLHGEQLGPPPNTSFHPSRILTTMGNRGMPNDFIMKRRSLQILDDSRHNMYNGNNNPNFSSLGRGKVGATVTNPELFQEERYKRYSLAEPRCNTNYISSKEPSSHMFGTYGSGQGITGELTDFNRTERYSQNSIKEDQRSVSHYDVKKVSENKNPSAFNPPSSRTSSATALTANSHEPSAKASNTPSSSSSPRFFKKKIISLLNKPEKESKTCGGSPEDEGKKVGKKKGSTTNSASSQQKGNGGLSIRENHFLGEGGTSSAPRFSTEELSQDCMPSGAPTNRQVAPASRPSQVLDARQRDHKVDRRLYSRFEPFCSFEKKTEKGSSGAAHLHGLETRKSLPSQNSRGVFSSEHNTTSRNQVQGHHENKFGRFIQRVGNFIHKNK